MRILEPGEYPCRVHHPTAGEFFGLASVEGSEAVELQVYEWPTPASGVWSFGDTHHIDALLCKLYLGTDLTLFDATAVEIHPGRLLVRASLALAAPPFYVDADTKYFSAEVQITNGHRVFGTWPIRSVEFPKEEATTGTNRHSALLDADSMIETTFGEGIQLTASYSVHEDLFDRYRYTVVSEPVFTLTSLTAMSPTAWVSTQLLPLRDFVSLATLEPQRLAAAALYSPDNDERERQWPYTLYSSDIDQAPYQPTADVREDGRTLLTLKDIGSELPGVVARWLKFRAEQPGVAGPLFSTLTQRSDARTQFLGLVQSLEGLHSYRFSQGPVPTEVHKTRRKEVFAELVERDVSPEALKWLKQWTDTRGDYRLADRLKQLKKDSERDLAEINGQRLDPTEIAMIRNHLSHGAANAYSPAGLRPHVQAMAMVGVAQLLRVLEVPPTNLSRFFK